jgi:hypothetical protein
MSNGIQAHDHSQADLYRSVKALNQQFDELQRLRDRVRRAEAKAVRARRYQGRRQEKGYDYSMRSGDRIH